MSWSSAITPQRNALCGWATMPACERYVSHVEEPNPGRWHT